MFENSHERHSKGVILYILMTKVSQCLICLIFKVKVSDDRYRLLFYRNIEEQLFKLKNS